MGVCRHWGEYDDDKGLFEWCKAVKKTAYCGACINHCPTPSLYAEGDVGIAKGKPYRIKGVSGYFKRKYGVSNPIILIEDRDVNVWGKPWHQCSTIIAVVYFIKRLMEDGLAVSEEYFFHEKNTGVWYGKVSIGEGNGSLGELVHEIELEEIGDTNVNDTSKV
jgi:hypothetical protein